jgi:hypothetical protein
MQVSNKKPIPNQLQLKQEHAGSVFVKKAKRKTTQSSAYVCVKDQQAIFI